MILSNLLFIKKLDCMESADPLSRNFKTELETKILRFYTEAENESLDMSQSDKSDES